MKLTPEQKAILAYGEARGILKERKSLMRFTEGSGECSDYHGAPRIMYGVEEAIRDAWQKHAGHGCQWKTDIAITVCTSNYLNQIPPARNVLNGLILSTGNRERRGNDETENKHLR